MKTTETWLRLERFPDYEVSSAGRFRRGDYVKKPIKHARGYLCYGIGKYRKELAHRLVCEAFHGPAPSPEYEVAHNNGVRDDNRAENVRWSTAKDNQEDRKAHGTYLAGEQCVWSVRLTEQKVDEIRAAYAAGGRRYAGGSVTMATLAERHGVSLGQISRVVNGKHWRPDGHLRSN